MSRGRTTPRGRALALWIALAVSGALPLRAQVVDTTRVDTLARRDTTDYTAQFLKAQQEAKQLIPVMPRIGSTLLLPVRTRYILDRDSVVWHTAETVGDLLTRVPGVFLLRGGWAGRPELPAYQAHGATSVQYLVDGIPFFPLGQDSLMVDPSLLPLSFVDRVEIERMPGRLTVWLFTRRNDRGAPYSRIGIGSGDLGIERYQGQLEKRSRRGPGFAAAFDHLGVPIGEGESGDYRNTHARLRLDFVRSPKAGAEVQLFLSAPDREAVLGGAGDTLSRARHGNRRDLSARVFYAPGQSGLGPRFDLVASRSSWTDQIQKDSTLVVTDILDTDSTVIGQDSSYQVDKYHRSVVQLGALASYRLAAAGLDAALWWRSQWTPLELRAGGGIAPLSWLSFRVDGSWLKHEGSRSSKWLSARAGMELPLGFSASAVWRKGEEVMLPVLENDVAQDVDDRSVSLGWRSSFAELEGSFTTNAAFRPTAYAQYPMLAGIAPRSRTDWVAVSGRLAPRQWISVSGWYSNALRATPEGQPPGHLQVLATIQSKFLPTFRSGIFNLKLQVGLERWNRGVLGSDSTSAPVILEPATFFRGYLGIQIGSFIAYYDRYNMQGTLKGYVPGLLMPRYASTFVVRWEFAN